MSTTVKDRIIGLGTLLFAIFNFVYLMPKVVGKIGRPETFFPIFTTSVLMIVGFLLTLGTFRGKAQEESPSLEEASSKGTSRGKFLLAVLISLIYCFLLEKVGFLVLTPICLVGAWVFFEVRSWKIIIFTTILLIVAIYLLFEFGLRAPLPEWEWQR
jgi:putative tricarboxylic transport membrane protein